MKIAIKLFFMAALALTFAACSSNDDNEFQNPAQQPASGEITITATIDANDGATTRTLGIDGENIASTWDTNDEFAILFNDGTNNVKRTATISSITGTTATITFTVSAELADNTACTIVYPASAANAANTGADVATALATQNGALATAPDVRVGTATIDKTNHNLSNVTKLAAQNAIFKFTIQNLSGADKTATEFKVSDGSGNLITTVTLGTATGVLYVALPEMAAGTYWFNATIGSKPYIAKATTTAATVAGTYYQTTVKMATLGDLMADNSKFYAVVGDIPAGKQAIGVIAYLGSDATTEAIANSGGHGLVLCLKNAASAVCWSTDMNTLEFSGQQVDGVDDLMRTTNVSGYTNTTTLAAKTDASTKYPAAYLAKNYTTLPAPATGTTGWFLPSAQQWVKMQEALGGIDGSTADLTIKWNSYFDTYHTGADKWEAALAKAGTKGTDYDSMTSTSTPLKYWSSSENSTGCAVGLTVDATGTVGNYGFCWADHPKDNQGGQYRVRPVLAF